MRKIISLTVLIAYCLVASAEVLPTINVSMDAQDGEGKNRKENVTSYMGSAPITATFHFETEHAEGWDMSYEWRFCHQGGTLDEPYMIRYEEEPEIIFTMGGTDSIALYATFKRGEEKIEMRRDYWTYEDQPMVITTSMSVLTMPNAFSPNNDGKNDYYKPKVHQSIVEFKAIIFNRWGQKIYEWSNANDQGWDGTFNGKPVKEGTYFALIRAKGADGTVYEFKKDVNLLRSSQADERNGNEY